MKKYGKLNGTLDQHKQLSEKIIELNKILKEIRKLNQTLSQSFYPVRWADTTLCKLHTKVAIDYQNMLKSLVGQESYYNDFADLYKIN